MAKSAGLGQRLYLDGINLSGDVGSIDSCSSPRAVLDVTGIDKSAMERIHALKDGALDFTAFWNPAAGAAHVNLSTLPTTDRALLYATGTAIGDPGAGMVAKQLNYDGTRATDGAFTFTVSSQANGYGLEWGRLLTTATRTDTAATNGASYDYGVDVGTTAFGLQMYVQLIAFSGTSVTIKVQSSTDDGGGDAFADITGATTGALSAIGATRIATANNASVERYLRVVTTGTFSNAEFVVLVVRNTETPVF